MYTVLLLLMINTSLVNTVLLVSSATINRVYDIQETLCILIMILLIILSFFDLKQNVKIVVTSISLVILVLHYYILIIISQYVELTILPFFIVETAKYGSVASIDYGQLMVILMIVVWRREIWSFIKSLMRRRCACIGETSSENKQ